MVLKARPMIEKGGGASLRRKEPTVLLFGVGAPRCGTTWLYRFLSGHPDCHFRGMKELHYFDSFHGLHIDWTLKLIEDEFNELQQASLAATGTLREDILASLADIHEYYQLMKRRVDDRAGYARFLLNGIGSKKLVGDISPTYCILPIEAIREMVATSAHSRFVYVMREPLERLWSHVRLMVRKDRAAAEEYDRLSEQILRGILNGEQNEHKKLLEFSDYVSAIEKLKAAVPAERLHITFAEEMLTQTGARKLCKFLGIRPVRAEFDEKINSALPARMSADLRAETLSRLRPQYEYVAKNFPALPAAWQRTMNEEFA